jgi:hypothetical protein
MAPSHRPIRSSRTRVQSYREEGDSDDSDDGLPSSTERHLNKTKASSSTPPRPRRQKRVPTSYRDPSTDEDLSDSVGGHSENIESAGTGPGPHSIAFRYKESTAIKNSPHGRHRVGQRSHQTGSPSAQTAQSSPAKRRKITLGSPTRTQKIEREREGKLTAIPPWQTLPHHVLFDIFAYACACGPREHTSNPRDDYIVPFESAKWLVGIARLCRSFLDPALSVLYHNPPLTTPAKAHLFLNLLLQPQGSLSIAYTNKIKHIQLNVETILLYKIGPSGYFKLCRLIERSPQVKSILLYHDDNRMVGSPVVPPPRSKWTYPDSLFETLRSCQIRLRAWEWNARFMEPEHLLPLILSCHREAPFIGLRDLRLFHIPSEDIISEDEEEDYRLGTREVIMAAALNALPELRRLEFIQCLIVNECLLPNLPPTLTSLAIENCDDVATSNFAPFLATHGQNLRELTLNHNRHLNLSFTARLAECCPRLEKLRTNLSIHCCSPHHSLTPHFKRLFSPSEAPTWPKTLQEIEMLHLRNWDDTQAATFFSSLINSAAELKDLRKLVISVILEIGWRDRACFREEWIGRLERVFLRRSQPPSSNPQRFLRRAYHNAATKPASSRAMSSDGAVGSRDHTPVSSRPSTPSKRKSARIAQQRLSDTDDLREINATQPLPRSSKPGVIAEAHDTQTICVQGMCNVVSIRIDNLRPRDTLFGENDFLDDELSGDEDWIAGHVGHE